jgi:hypothetical protein
VKKNLKTEERPKNGDTPYPRGGVKNVIPEKMEAWAQ